MLIHTPHSMQRDFQTRMHSSRMRTTHLRIVLGGEGGVRGKFGVQKPLQHIRNSAHQQEIHLPPKFCTDITRLS